MSALSNMMLFLALAELLLVSLCLLVIAMGRNKRLKQQLHSVSEALIKERRPATIKQRLVDYLHEEIERTEKKCQAYGDSADRLSQQDQLQLRKSVLALETKTLAKNPLDQDYWQGLELGYSELIPEPQETEAEQTELVSEQQDAELQALPDVIETDVIETPPEADISSPSVIRNAAGEELDRLKNVINNQYQSIDELKQQLLDLDQMDEAFLQHPAIQGLQEKLQALAAEQDQMSMCVKVLEGENERLTHLLQEHLSAPDLENKVTNENDPGGENDKPSESEAIRRMAKEIQDAENLIRDLLRTNKEQLQCIATLEGEMDAAHIRQEDTEQADNQESEHATEAVTGDLLDDQQRLKESEKLIANLVQTNKEHLQCIAVLESEVEELSQRIHSQNTMAEGSQDGGALETEAADHLADVEKRLHKTLAELDLLHADYDSMKEKYIALFQEKQSREQRDQNSA